MESYLTMLSQEQYEKMNLTCKLNGKLLLVYDDYFNYVEGNPNNDYKSIIYDITTQKPIASQYNKIICGVDSVKKFIENNKFSKLNYKKSYEGTHIIVFYHDDKWNITTKKCLDLNESYWNKSMTHYQMFIEAINGKFELDDLDKNYCYHFNLIHHLNYRNIKYKNFGENYAILDLIFITEKDTLKILDITLKDVLKNYNKEWFDKLDNKHQTDNFDVILEELAKMTKEELENNNNVYLENEGYIIEHYDMNNKLTLLKIQTPLYEYIYTHPIGLYDMSHPKYDILYRKFLINQFDSMDENNKSHFDMKDKEYINGIISLYFKEDIIKDTVYKIFLNIKNLSYALTSLYFLTRKHTLMDYNIVPVVYRNAIYEIHGNYMGLRKSGFKVNQQYIFTYLIYQSPIIIKDMLKTYDNVVEIINKETPSDAKGIKRKFYNIVLPEDIFKNSKV